MGYKVKNKKIDYQADHIIKVLGDFLLSNRKFLNIFTNIIIDEKMNLTIEHIKLLIQRNVFGGIINEDEGKTFLKLCYKFLCYGTRGNLLEYIVCKLGPFRLHSYNYDYACRTIIIYNNEKLSEANFDLVFFDKDFAEYTTDGYININIYDGEFIECKTDIRTFISQKLSSDALKKLNFIKNVYNCFDQNPFSFFCIITFRKETAIYKVLLQNQNYEFVNIIGGKELCDKI